MRLDALARWLQDIAYADVEDAGLAQHAVWVVRRTRLRIERFPRFGERFVLHTFCSGLGRMWAERRTTIRRADHEARVGAPEDSQLDVEAASLWVHLDPASWRPAPFSDEELVGYGDAAAGRRVTARLRHPAPVATNESRPWRFRATERDIAGHVNNAAYLEPLEEELLSGPEPDRLDVEIEYRTPSQAGDKLVLESGNCRWIVSADGETHASILFA
jgi:acyl-ACP thioesterase